MEAFGGSPGMYKALVEGILKDPGRVRNVNSITDAERRATEQEVSDTVKAALIISEVDKQQYGKLTDELANNYLLGTDQYPNTFDKAVRILGNYQTSRIKMPYRANPNNKGVAFLQRGRLRKHRPRVRRTQQRWFRRKQWRQRIWGRCRWRCERRRKRSHRNIECRGSNKDELVRGVTLLPLWHNESLGIRMPSTECGTARAASHEPGEPSRKRWGSRRPSTSVAQHNAALRRKPT